MIRFKFVPEKALAAIWWMIQQQPGVDLHTVMKACYFADKQHLNEHGCPIFGATYRAMPFGPVPLEIYEMAKGEPMWLAELGRECFPWTLEGYHLMSRTGEEETDADALTESNWKALRAGFDRSRSMTFNSRTAATHGRDWQLAALGLMDYVDMIDDNNPRKKEMVERLAETARFLRL